MFYGLRICETSNFKRHDAYFYSNSYNNFTLTTPHIPLTKHSLKYKSIACGFGKIMISIFYTKNNYCMYVLWVFSQRVICCHTFLWPNRWKYIVLICQIIENLPYEKIEKVHIFINMFKNITDKYYRFRMQSIWKFYRQ